MMRETRQHLTRDAGPKPHIASCGLHTSCGFSASPRKARSGATS